MDRMVIRGGAQPTGTQVEASGAKPTPMSSRTATPTPTPRANRVATKPEVTPSPSPTASVLNPGWPWLLLGALAVTGVLYWPSLHNGLTNWDDPDYLTNNPLLDFRKTPLSAYFSTIISGNRHPLTMLSLSLDYALSGLNPYQFHRTNLLLHLLNVVLTFGVAGQWSGGRRWVAFFVALWFGVHPMHVESVAWLSARKDVLYGFFFLLSLGAWWQFLTKRQRGWWTLSLLCALLANLAKPAAVILPALLALLVWWQSQSTGKLPLTIRQLLPTLPFFALSACFAFLTVEAQASASAINTEFSLWERTQLAGYGLVNYTAKAIAPVGLSALYGRPAAGTPFPALFAVYTVLSGLGVASLIWLYKRSALWFFGLAFFGLNLLLTLQFIRAVGSAAYADRYTYVAYTGLFFTAAFTFDQIRDRTKRVATLALAVVFSLTCAGLTMQRVGVWKSAETLWTDVLKTQPYSATAYSNRALYYEQHDRLDEALADYDLAVRADPRPLFRANRAYLLSKLNRPADAEADADFLLTQTPNDAVALTIKGTALVGKGQYPNAITYLTRSYALDSTYLNTVVNLGSAYFMNRQYTEAIPFYQRAIARDSNNAEHWTNLTATYLQSERYADALAASRRALALSPNSGPAHLYAAYSLQKLGRAAEAKPEAAQAQRLGQVVDERMFR